MELNLAQANNLASLPLHCAEMEYPNKLNNVIGSDEDLRSPKELHPAFYGCFDWHSAVHGHWSMVSLLKQFPELEEAPNFRRILKQHLSKENISVELAYFHGKHNQSWERTYGWAWLLKLVEELHTWDDPLSRELEENLQPLAQLLAQRFVGFLNKLQYPIRVGEHPNTAFGMNFAYDYAIALDDASLKEAIIRNAKRFYLKDAACPIDWEPGGFDFLSPCLEEAALMRRVLKPDEFDPWLDLFLPQLADKNFDMETGIVSDRKDGKMVHLDGVNFSRAWNLFTIAQGKTRYKHLQNIANKHIQYSLPNLVDDDYEGGHWLGSFAIYALNAGKYVE
ncbi:MAG: DUF2891 domain-containing protein [Flavobacteriaceae bacterium]|nr:DUF2891 domain-containing protein [Flavobacteriaceae bacterium]